ncbi:MAG TPA: amidohydrolase family protein [Sphingomicrobium sp.]|nr:amidohydrolase family protein [Sphingomicrobium sp.]
MAAWIVFGQPAAAGSGGRQCSNVSEITWGDIDVSPDDQTYLVSILGDIYRIDANSGQSIPIRRGSSWDTKPKFSPDGRKLAFISDADGGPTNLFVADAEGGQLRRVSSRASVDVGLRDIADFDWMPNGRSLLAANAVSRRASNNELIEYSLDHQPAKAFGSRTANAAHISVSPRQRLAHFTMVAADGDLPFRSRIFRLDLSEAGIEPQEVRIAAGMAAVSSSDGRYLAFVRHVDGRTALWVRDLRTGRDRELVPEMTPDQLARTGQPNSQGLIPDYDFTSDGRKIVLVLDGQINRVDVETGARSILPFSVEHCTESNPKVSGRQIAIGTDFQPLQLDWPNLDPKGRLTVFGGVAKIWKASSRTTGVAKLQDGVGQEYAPTSDPRGRTIAYINWTDRDGATLRVFDLASGRSGDVAKGERLGQPLWSQRGELWFLQRSAHSCDDKFVAAEAAAACRVNPKVEKVEIIRAKSSGSLESVFASWLPYYLATKVTWTLAPRADRIYLGSFDLQGDSPDELPKIIEINLKNRTSSIVGSFAQLVAGDLEGISIAPGGRHVAVLGRDGLWMLDLPKAIRGSGPVEVSSWDQMRRIGPYAAHPRWQFDGSLAWFSGARLYRWKPGNHQASLLRQIRWRVPRPSSTGMVAIKNARLIPMTKDDTIERGTIVVEDSRIRAIGPSDEINLPAEATIIDGTGMTIMPGIVDTHGHAHREISGQDGYFYGSNLNYLANLSWGVTTLFDPQANTDEVFPLAEMVASGEILGPRIFSTGDAIFGSTVAGQSWVNSVSDLKIAVDRRTDAGAIMIKSYLVDRRDWRQAIVRFANDRGVGVTSEGGGRTDQLSHVVDGETALEHNLRMYPLKRDVVDFMARSGIYYTPVLVSSMSNPPEGRAWFYSRGFDLQSVRYLRFSRAGERNRSIGWRYTPDSEQSVFAIGRSALDVVRAGGKVTIGSHGEQQGLSAHWDMWLLALSGFTPFEVLQAATIRGAEKLGLEHEIGTLEVGKLADFLVLNGNPLEDIRQTANLRYVVQSGIIFDAESLTRLYPSHECLNRPRQRTSEEWEKLGTCSAALAADPGIAPPH